MFYRMPKVHGNNNMKIYTIIYFFQKYTIILHKEMHLINYLIMVIIIQDIIEKKNYSLDF